MERTPKKIRPSRDKFVVEYLKTGIGEQSAIAAGYSAATARKAASRLLTRVDIRERIRAGREAAFEAGTLSVVEVANELKIIAFSDLADFLSFAGDEVVERSARTIPKAKRRALQSIKITTKTRRDGDTAEIVDRVVEYKLWSKIDALDRLMHILGMKLDKDDLKRLQDQIAALEARMPRAAE